jgi:predicted ABC-type ATPase
LFFGRGKRCPPKIQPFSQATFEQTHLARQAGFALEMWYLNLRDFGLNLERIKARADAEGHSAFETTLQRIYNSSVANLRKAVSEMDDLWIYDNSPFGRPPILLAQAEKGTILFLIERPPGWLERALDVSY